MTDLKQSKSRFRLPPLGLALQLFVFILLPLTLLLVVITFGSISIHQREMRNLVGERDAVTVHAAASALNAQIDNRVKELSTVNVLFSANSTQPITTTLDNLNNMLSDFDAGMAVLNDAGEVVAAHGNLQTWKSWTADPGWQTAYATLMESPGKFVVYQNPQNGELVGLIGSSLENKGLLVGALSINQLVESTLGESLPSNGQLSISLVGANQQLLYQVGDLADQSEIHPGIAEALQGQSGIVYVKVAGDEHVTAYSPVPIPGWALITEESWQAVSTSALQASQIAPLALVPAVFIMLLALWFGATQVVRPLRDLESRTASLAVGDFKTIQRSVGGISEIQHLQKELVQMADRVEEAQRSLHNYIGAITDAQEEERQRLARELHDDTLQALIALKQRVQLTQLELQVSSQPAGSDLAQLDEILSLTEQTIENLRRLTRALRPVYLEDLGLVPALEMLARETGQSAVIQIEFNVQGIEKRLSASNELAIYRMAQEACSNIIRHAQAKKASMIVTYSPQIVTLRIDDDGVGFKLPENPSEYAATGHYGLLGLHERAELMDASLDIQSALGSGTRVTISLPVQSA